MYIKSSLFYIEEFNLQYYSELVSVNDKHT